MNMTAVAKFVGISKQSLSVGLNKNDSSYRSLSAVADALEVDIVWLATGSANHAPSWHDDAETIATVRSDAANKNPSIEMSYIIGEMKQRLARINDSVEDIKVFMSEDNPDVVRLLDRIIGICNDDLH